MPEKIKKVSYSSCGTEKPTEDEIEAIKAYQKKKTRKNLELYEISSF